MTARDNSTRNTFQLDPDNQPGLLVAYRMTDPDPSLEI